jgi:hypothetical protein
MTISEAREPGGFSAGSLKRRPSRSPRPDRCSVLQNDRQGKRVASEPALPVAPPEWAVPDSPGVILSAHPPDKFMALSEAASMPLLSPSEITRRRIVVSPSPRARATAPSPRAPRRRPWMGVVAAATLTGLCVVLGLGACAEDKQSDTLVAGPAPSAPAGVQGGGGSGTVVDTRCFSANDIGGFVNVSDDFPWCVVAVHAAQYGDDSIEAQNFSAFGQPSWFQEGSTNGPLTGGKTRPGAPGAATSLDKWSIPAGNRTTASQNFLDVTADLVPTDSVFTAALGLTLNSVPFTILAHASPSGEKLGETFLVNATGFIRSTVNGIVAAAPPSNPSAGELFYYTGLSAYYEGESPPKAAGLYRTSCDFGATTCSSALVAGWSDTPGLVTTDVEGNLVAVHSSFGTGRELVGFPASSLGGETAGSALFSDSNITKSITIIDDKGAGQKYLVSVETSANDVAQPVAVRPVAFDADAQTATLGDQTIPGTLTAAAGVRLQVFHDLSGQLWIAADKNGNDPGGEPTFLVFSLRSN